MKIYTRTGDEGLTALIGGQRVSKNDPRLQSYGTLDELNSLLGVARAAALPAEIDAVVELLQHDLFGLGAELAAPEAEQRGMLLLADAAIERIEQQIDDFEATLTPLTQFILPGGTPGAAALHTARCVCRRAERMIVALAASAPVRPIVIRYLNRVGDLLFVLARAANAAAGVPDQAWDKGKR
ncbi:MAG: cob(I)yrinic acid a,c-diamide adenosyltransferase [Planctomycetales bacterium]|nr:cob(I)yrinic acid a,c-diamide adenosyltransferase [Planctomycetales bacterium]